MVIEIEINRNFFEINADEVNFYIFVYIDQILSHIKEHNHV